MPNIRPAVEAAPKIYLVPLTHGLRAQMISLFMQRPMAGSLGEVRKRTAALDALIAEWGPNLEKILKEPNKPGWTNLPTAWYLTREQATTLLAMISELVDQGVMTGGGMRLVFPIIDELEIITADKAEAVKRPETDTTNLQ
jgi:hypothetical protein